MAVDQTVLKTLPERTAVTIHTGASRYSATADDPITPDDPRVYNLSASSYAVTEGGSPVKVQVYASRLSSAIGRVPFVVTFEGQDEPAQRGIHYQIEDSDGNVIQTDIFLVPGLQLRGDLYIRALDDLVAGPERTFRISIVEEADGEQIDGLLGGNTEAVVSIVDAGENRLSAANSTINEDEPESGASQVIEIPFQLSAPAASDVTATVTVTSATAQLNVNFATPTLQFTIPTGEMDGVFPLTLIGDQTTSGNHSYRITLSTVTGPAVLHPTATITDLNVAESDDPLVFPIRFATSHNGAAQVREGDPAIKLRVEIATGVAADQSIEIDWLFEQVGAVPVSLGSNMNTSAPNPLVIAAGATFAEIDLSAPANANVGDGNAWRVSLTGISSLANAYLSTVAADLVIDGTTVDTTTPLPRAQWQGVGELSLVEGSSAVKNIVLDVPAPNPIQLSFSRSGVGTADLGFDGDTVGGVTIEQGSTFVGVGFDAILDSVSETSEVATITIEGTSEYEAVTNADELVVTVTEQVSGDTLVEFPPLNGMDGMTLVSVVTGTDPTDPSTPPAFNLGGQPTDVFPVDPGREGGAVGWEFVAWVDGTSGQVQLQPGAISGGALLYDQGDISDLRFQLQTHCENRATQFEPHEVLMSEAIFVETSKLGSVIREDVYLLRPTLPPEAGTIHARCAEITLVVQRRPDGILILGDFTNEGYWNTETKGHFPGGGVRGELSGTIHFKDLQIFAPTNYRLDQDEVRTATSTGSTNLIVATASGRPHKIPPQRQFSFACVLQRTDGAGVAPSVSHQIMDGAGWGDAKTGPLASRVLRPWFSPDASVLPLFGDAYSANIGGTQYFGMEASRQYAIDFKQRAINCVRGLAPVNTAGSAPECGFWETRTSKIGGDPETWFLPANSWDSYAPGGNLIFLQMGFDFFPEAMRAHYLFARQMVQAMPVGLLDIRTGKQIGLAELVPTNTLAPGNTTGVPWFVNNLTGLPTWYISWFVPRGRRPGDSNYDIYAMRPFDRDWNAVPPAIAESAKVEPIGAPVLDCDFYGSSNQSNIYSWPPVDHAHFVRANKVFQALAWSRNCTWAKRQLVKQALHVQRCYPHIPIRGGETYPGGNHTIARKSAELTLVNSNLSVAVSGGQDGTNQGGYSHWGIFGPDHNYARSRDTAHASDAVAAAMCVLPWSDPRRQELREWTASWLDKWHKIATPWGGAESQANGNRQGQMAAAPGSVQPLNLPYRDASDTTGNPLRWQNAVPFGSQGSQGWPTAYAWARAYSLHKADHQLAQFPLIEKFVKKGPLAITRVPPLGARPATSNQAQWWNIYTQGNNGQADNLSDQGTFHENDRPHSVALIPVAGNTLNPYADFRWQPAYTACIRAAHEQGDSATRDEMLGYVKLHWNLSQGASNQALINRLQAEMNPLPTDPTGRFVASCLSDMVGFLQHLEQ